MNTFIRKVRVALTPREFLLKTTLSNGAVVYGKNRAGFGGRGIYIFGEGLEPEFQHLERFLTPGAVFMDVGANTGIYTVKAAKYLSTSGGTVVAVEPFPDVFATLFHSIEANGFHNVRLRNFCAGAQTGATVLWRNFNQPVSFSLTRLDDKAACLSSLMVALDDLFDWEGLNRLDYLKLDVEGAESEVLTGAARIIERYRPIIQMEVNLKAVAANLRDYTVFRAPGSPNEVHIPNESPKLHLPRQLGWELASAQ